MRKITSLLLVGIMLMGAFAGMVTTSTENVRAATDYGLVAYWDFDEGSGTVLHDKSGNGNDGTIYGATWTDGINGSALSFDGVDDHVEVDDSPSFDFGDKVSLEVWIKPVDSPETEHIVSKCYSNGAHWLVLQMTGANGGSNGVPAYAPGFSVDGGSGDTTITGQTMSINVWHHIVGVYDGSEMSLYVDGTLEASTPFTGTMPSNSNPLWIGAKYYPPDPGYFFKGLIDEVRIYNRALSSTEVTQHYQGTFLDKTGLVGYWNLDEGSGTIAHDYSGNGNDGTIYGATWTDGINGGGLSFDGTNDYVDFTSLDSMEFSEGTIELWFKSANGFSAGSSNEDLFSKDGANLESDSLELYLDGDTGKLAVDFGDPTGNFQDNVQLFSDSSGWDDAWHSVSLIWGELGVKLYVDGILQSRQSEMAKGVGAYETEIGAVRGTCSFDGKIDEVRIYDYALSSSDIKEHYEKTLVTDSDNDGLPDSWEIEYFGTLSHAANSDYDNDGYTNLEEYNAGTDPTSKTSHPGGISGPDTATMNYSLFILLLLVVIGLLLGVFAVKRRKRTEAPVEVEEIRTDVHAPEPRIKKEQVDQIYDLEKGGHVYGFGDFFAYKIDKNIGSGGFSEVYLVKSQKDGKFYAMKVPNNANLSGDSTIELSTEDIERYGKEAKIWSSLTQKAGDSVINLIDVGVRPFPWFVMELAPISLAKKMKDMSKEEKLSVAGDLLTKLDKIHKIGVVHKDIKPENILYADGKWKFTDFGLSKTIDKSSKSSTTMSGTWFYMAPEQVSKKFGHTDHRTDIWQMGIMLYKMLTGHYPFESDDAFEATSAILHDEPVPGTEYGMDEKLWNVIKKALEKKKEDRWQSAMEFKRALEEVMK